MKAVATSASARSLLLTRVAVRGFKAVKDSGYVDLRPFTLFIGRNGSGKSSFVEALQWLQESLFYGLQEATERRFRTYLFLRNKRSTTTSLHLELQGGGEPLFYDLEVEKATGATARPVVRDEELKVGRTRAQTRAIWTTSGPDGRARNFKNANPELDPDALALASAPNRAGRPVQSLGHFLRRMVVLRLSPTAMTTTGPLEWRARGPMLDEEGRQLPALLNSLNAEQRAWVRAKVAAAVGDIRNVKVVGSAPGRGYVAAVERMKWPGRSGAAEHTIPSWLLSEGTRRITALYTLLAVEPRPSLLLIEEIENGLDPWTLEQVLGALREATSNGIQIILTTHSPFLLDHVNPEEVIHVERKLGDSTYTAITDYRDVLRYRGAVAPGAMYLAGYLERDDK